jgi:hypothetical protein
MDVFALVLQAKSELTARTDALCNATLLSASFQYCGLNSAEEAARADLTRIEDSIDTLKRQTATAQARLQPLLQPATSCAQPTSSEHSAHAASPLGAHAHAQSAGDSRRSPASGWLQRSTMHQKRILSAGPLRVAKNGETYTGRGTGWRSVGLFGGVNLTESSSSSTDGAPRGGRSWAAKTGGSLLTGSQSRARAGMRGTGGVVGVVAGVEMNSQQLEKLKEQVRCVEQQLEHVRKLQNEVAALCDETVRQYA